MGEMGYGLDGRRFESRQVQGIFYFTTASRRLALGPTQVTQSPIQWIPGAFNWDRIGPWSWPFTSI